jgi:hypothetical protein
VKGPLKEQIQESNDDPSPYFCTVLTICNHWVPVLIPAVGIVRWVGLFAAWLVLAYLAIPCMESICLTVIKEQIIL